MQLFEALLYKPVRSPIVSLKYFIDIILPDAIMVMGLTQPVTEMSTRNIFGEGGVKAAGA